MGYNDCFSKFIEKVKNCDDNNCKLHRNISENAPIQLDHENISDVRILIITEQPKILKNKEKVTNENFLSDVEDSTTVKNLKSLLGQEFIDNIKNRRGQYYWTHHTKCPSEKREPQYECMNRYFREELNCFKNLKLIISFGSKSYELIREYDCINNKSESLPGKFFDYFYSLLEENITKFKRVYEMKISNKNIPYLALPHPSNTNSMHAFLNKMDNMIKGYIDIAKK